MHYAIFVPRPQLVPGQPPLRRPPATPAEALGDVGLADLGCEALGVLAVQDGPGEQAGTLYFWGDARSVPRERTGWKWAPAPARGVTIAGADKHPGGLPAGRYWVGWNPLVPPTPRELQRPTGFLGGLEVTLEDGNAWTIPTAKVLPRRVGLDASGQVALSIDPAFERFCDLVENLMAHLATADPNTGVLQIPNCWGVATAALGINYRLNAELISALGLFNDRSMVDVCLAVVELPLDIHYVDVEKKTELVARFTPATSAGSLGATDSLAICPPGAI